MICLQKGDNRRNIDYDHNSVTRGHDVAQRLAEQIQNGVELSKCSWLLKSMQCGKQLDGHH